MLDEVSLYRDIERTFGVWKKKWEILRDMLPYKFPKQRRSKKMYLQKPSSFAQGNHYQKMTTRLQYTTMQTEKVQTRWQL